ncbi:hypothetical protein [Pleionea sp. CnH1-48]|uniref:hypothetical protein n=1 Tax=Pleionea sp. CnH1-48 TaxID=2954494 RepID=UPI002096CDFD|nr:hypothetical protein [Pleionea sp. CnH1-48]MCO7225752.1 hypothetical protein [Pleionea sp. CnH1-48]
MDTTKTERRKSSVKSNCIYYSQSKGCNVYSCQDCIKQGAGIGEWSRSGFETTERGYPDSVRVRAGVKESQSITSSGGSSGYYDFTITNQKGESLEVTCNDVIRCMVNNDFDLGNIVKAARRISEARQGRGKAGVSVDYDVNKIIYFSRLTNSAS